MADLYGKMVLCYTEVADYVDFQGIGNDPLYRRYDSVFSVVRDCIPAEYQHFLAQPLYDEDTDRIGWHVPTWHSVPQIYTSLDAEEQAHYEPIKQETIAVYMKALEQAKGENRTILDAALKYVDDHCLFCYDDKVVLVAWGMKPDTNQHRITGAILVGTPRVIKYALTFDSGEHGTLILPELRSRTRKAGHVFCSNELPEIQVHDGWNFVRWEPNPVGMKIKGDTTFTAVYEEDIVPEPPVEPEPPVKPKPSEPAPPAPMCNVTFQTDASGRLQGGSTIQVPKGTVLSAGMIPVVAAVTGKSFKGWSADVTAPINEDVIFTAMYEDENVTCEFDAGEHGHIEGTTSFSCAAGQVFPGTQIPKVVVDEGYKLKGWEPSIGKPVKQNTVFHAKYRKSWLALWRLKGCWKWLLWLLLILLLLLLLFFLIKGCSNGSLPNLMPKSCSSSAVSGPGNGGIGGGGNIGGGSGSVGGGGGNIGGGGDGSFGGGDNTTISPDYPKTPTMGDGKGKDGKPYDWQKEPIFIPPVDDYGDYDDVLPPADEDIPEKGGVDPRTGEPLDPTPRRPDGGSDDTHSRLPKRYKDRKTGRVRDYNGDGWDKIDDEKGRLPGGDVIPPVTRPGGDDAPITDLPDGSGSVVADRLLIYFEDDKVDMSAFRSDLERVYPACKVIGQTVDENVKSLVIQVPVNRREQIRDELPGKLPAYKFFVVDERIFESGASTSFSGVASGNAGWHLEAINLKQGWKTTRGNPNVIVAVVDDGCDCNHGMFADRIYKPYNVFLKNNRLSIGTGHGTHVAGLAVGSSTYYDKGASGVAPQCRLMPIQVFDNGKATFSSIFSGVLYAVHQGASVVNVSIGLTMSGFSSLPLEEQRRIINERYKHEEDAWKKVLSVAQKHNCIIVFAAGNDNILTAMQPAERTQSTLNVGAVAPGNKRANYSNHGEGTNVSAPGSCIYSSLPGNRYDFMDGTSMAAPIVSGVVALCKSIDSTLTAEELVQIVDRTGLEVAGLPKMVQVDRVLSAMQPRGSATTSPSQQEPDYSGILDEIRRHEEAIKKLKQQLPPNMR